MTQVPGDLRARLAADFHAVATLPPPAVRALWVAPFAALSLVAAPLYFSVRSDANQLGWMLTWGLSVMQAAFGIVVIGAALRESIPGRALTAITLGGLIGAASALMIAVTWITADVSEVPLRRGFWFVGAVCFGASAATALPVVAMANVLAARAYPTRPAIMGLLLGLGGGLIADAGWRLFCHFGELSHVLSAHAGGVVAAGIAGMTLALMLRRPVR
jgi:hypothetical protein